MQKSERPSPTTTLSASRAGGVRWLHLQLPSDAAQPLNAKGKSSFQRSPPNHRKWLAKNGRVQTGGAQHVANKQIQTIGKDDDV